MAKDDKPDKPRSPKTVAFNLRVSEAEKQAFVRAAEIVGLPVSAWVRARLRAAALLELDTVGEVAPFLKGGSSHGKG